MLFAAFAVLTLGLLTSLFPFMYPNTILNVLGVYLNLLLGDLVAGWLPPVRGTLVSVTEGMPALTLAGVFAVYGAPLMLVLAALRNR